MNAVQDQFVARATDDTFIRMLSNVLVRIVSENESKKGVVTRFHSMNAPSISIADYVSRIARHVRCSNECFVLALVYIERITRMHKNFAVSILNVHRLIITAVMLAAKFSDDVYYSNKFYAQVGGVNVTEINLLEAQFLTMLNFQLYVSALEYESCRMGVEKANLFGPLSSNIWGVAWYNATAKRSSRHNKAPASIPAQGGMPMVHYGGGSQFTNVARSTRYADGMAVDNEENVSLNRPYEDIQYTPHYERGGSNPGVHYCVPTQDTAMAGIPMRRAPHCPRAMDDRPRQPTGPSAGYHVLSNVHMPQILPSQHVDTSRIDTPGGHPIPMHPKGGGVCGGHGGHRQVARFTSAPPCCKHYAGSDAVPRRPPRAMLNRMCTQHVDYVGYPHSQWATVKRAAPADSGPAFSPMGSMESTDACANFMNALVARHRDSMKGKCAPRADTWSYEDTRQLCRSRNFMRCGKIKEAA
ncbi:cyclin, N-terminal domain containing protein, putative [Babesia bigemina]|uniref:Cyclin, N-terminal domain containing protein, putative n=1 Tax=Babesia bigemina TaxID=5866 RepID=A0A061D861_BABBI|nr:cyclin, N-terminal domain containing protein, putative [Babesia bigemina]CDR95109.1 cyclin, N-terminal domain containing protein, putative [Babesia bigemina]|eukprot:XP_012767295.1 cyclin, N-terminal domain containing protein, putative [Babesia bigemina]